MKSSAKSAGGQISRNAFVAADVRCCAVFATGGGNHVVDSNHIHIHTLQLEHIPKPPLSTLQTSSAWVYTQARSLPLDRHIPLHRPRPRQPTCSRRPWQTAAQPSVRPVLLQRCIVNGVTLARAKLFIVLPPTVHSALCLVCTVWMCGAPFSNTASVPRVGMSWCIITPCHRGTSECTGIHGRCGHLGCTDHHLPQSSSIVQKRLESRLLATFHLPPVDCCIFSFRENPSPS